MLLSFSALGGIALLVSRSDATPGTVRIVVPGVWFQEGDLDLGHCNNILIEMKGYLIVVDANIANWPVVLRAAEKLKVKYVLPGHGLPGGRELIGGQEQFAEAADPGRLRQDLARQAAGRFAALRRRLTMLDSNQWQ